MKKLLVILALIVPVAALGATPVPYLPVPKGAAVILNTGSTNALGYRIVIQQSGAAEYIHGDKRATATVPTAVTTKFFTDLQAAMPLTVYPMIHCMKSVSFGTSIFVWWKGSRSHDLTCGGGTLANDAVEVAKSLGLEPTYLPVRPIPMLTNEPRVPAPTPSSKP
jgi:hypothetical protein